MDFRQEVRQTADTPFYPGRFPLPIPITECNPPRDDLNFPGDDLSSPGDNLRSEENCVITGSHSRALRDQVCIPLLCSRRGGQGEVNPTNDTRQSLLINAQSIRSALGALHRSQRSSALPPRPRRLSAGASRLPAHLERCSGTHSTGMICNKLHVAQ